MDFIVDQWEPDPDFEWLGRIGDGSTSIVEGARHITVGTIVAVKMMNIFMQKRPEFLINEVGIRQWVLFET